jgi:hypothetical protein
MNRIPLLCISLLLATVFILQTTKPQTHVIYLASETNTMKVRPVGYTATDMKVVTAANNMLANQLSSSIVTL